jgi:ABC-2 type transport system permease protein
MVVHLALFELRLLLRKRITAFSVLAVPLFVCVMGWLQFRSLSDAEWPARLGLTYVLLLMLSVFLVSTTVFTARRQSLVLQRLRTSELSDNGVFTGISLPIMAVGLAQSVVFFVFCLVIGAPMPSQPVYVLIGLVLGVPFAMVAGIATAAFSRSVEVTQITSIPVVLAGMGGLFMVQASNPVLSNAGMFLPFSGPGQLIVRGWSGQSAALALVSTVVWLVLLGFTAHRFFKWEPRQ